MEGMTIANARHGTVLMEMAIALTLLLLLTFGLIEYGWLFQKAQHTANAARQGARVGATPDATIADVNAAVAAAMSAGGVEPANYTITRVPDDPSSLTPGQVFRVEILLDYEAVGLGFPLVPVPGSITLATTMAKEGPQTNRLAVKCQGHAPWMIDIDTFPHQRQARVIAMRGGFVRVK